MLPFRVLVAACLIVLAGCAPRMKDLPPPRADLPYNAVWVAPTTALVMPRPADLRRSVEAVQRVQVRNGVASFAYENRISVTPDRFRLVSVDGDGRTLMAITWTTGGVYYEVAPSLAQTLRPESVLADFVLLYWPEPVVRAGLVGGRLRSDARSRAVVSDAGELMRAEFQPAVPGDAWSGPVRYENVAGGYSVSLEPLARR